MSVLVYIETENGKIKKSAFEVISFARQWANRVSETLTGVIVNADSYQELSQYGVDRLIDVKEDRLKSFLPQPYESLFSQLLKRDHYKTLIFSSSSNSRVLASMLSARFCAAYIPNVVDVSPQGTVKRGIFNHKVFCWEKPLTEMVLLSVSQNSFEVSISPKEMKVECFVPEFSSQSFSVRLDHIEKSQEKVSLSDASIVVSGGRGMKGPEHWTMLESLAEKLDAALACSKPVSDMGWRPHSEHVGQTGRQIAPNVYIAVGISGAIQHLAGVTSAKTKIVINTDPEAPFFKSADYGIVGDAFEIVPKLIEGLS